MGIVSVIERPVASGANGVWGSDVIADTLRRLGVRYAALTPGSSFRGLHDSIVNHLGNTSPQMLLCLHEEHAVAIAHGYAKVTGEPLAAIVHSNVGLMHATMAVFNAWCDRVPLLLLGATGPVDAAARRPWIDWLHTCRDQGALIRHYIKWDDQPASIEAAVEALVRADRITRTAPHGPVYVNFDVGLQERRVEEAPPAPDLKRFQPPRPAAPPADAVAEAAQLLADAEKIVILAGRTSRSPVDWARRVALAEHLGARVITDIRVGAAFPTDHPLHVGRPAMFLDPVAADALKAADVILSLDWLDLSGTLKLGKSAGGKIIQVSLDHQLHNGWGMEHQGLPPADIHIASQPDLAVHAIADALGVAAGTAPVDAPTQPAVARAEASAELDIRRLAAALGEGLEGECVSLVRLPLGWSGDEWHFRHPLDFLGYDGGGGIGSGPGMLIGAALGLEGSGRLAVAVLGDGDLLMSASALWTASRYRIPLIAVIANNRSFFNDEVHQERVAVQRGRPVENKWIGQRIAGPDVDIAALARAQGVEAIGPVSTAGELAVAVKQAVEIARSGAPVVIDARVVPAYGAGVSAAFAGKAATPAAAIPPANG
ncbi:thiamine pyrophosphate-binding protein [Xanthobacter sediminis]|uniref:thiamine pyrophosphate-binding protein n=1 Tax=Xanthobacter sediminis TaxID=3119926 RepID=UPI003729C259